MSEYFLSSLFVFLLVLDNGVEFHGGLNLHLFSGAAGYFDYRVEHIEVTVGGTQRNIVPYTHWGFILVKEMTDTRVRVLNLTRLVG